MKQPKWITEIEFVERPHTGYWEARGWSNEAWRKVNSGFFSPRPATGLFGIFDRTAHVTAPAEIWGWALAGPAGIKGVDVSFDDGKNWSAAEIVDERGYNVWTVWRYRFAPQKPGEYVIRARATDGDGVAQPRSDRQTGSGQSGQAVMGVTVTAA
jgi:DMSO/TMAO reductase YedYZ molybdopterin-dependent catalytic subunit